jgi:hypothetical protein
LETNQQKVQQNRRFVVLAPDLLGSGTACNATIIGGNGTTNTPPSKVAKFPLFNISDWTDQMDDLMDHVENSISIDQWCVVANGGCSPIALQLAAKSVNKQTLFRARISNVILSSVPNLPFFLARNNSPSKVEKSYRTLCGILGKLFWWYACRNDGAFIQKFSEKNLVADPTNLGDQWRLNCYTTAKMNGHYQRWRCPEKQSP